MNLRQLKPQTLWVFLQQIKPLANQTRRVFATIIMLLLLIACRQAEEDAPATAVPPTPTPEITPTPRSRADADFTAAPVGRSVCRIVSGATPNYRMVINTERTGGGGGGGADGSLTDRCCRQPAQLTANKRQP